MQELDYLYVLKSLAEIPFGVGRKLLIDFLKGERNNNSISRNRLDKLKNFGSLAYSSEELHSIIDSLLLNNMIQQDSVNGNRFRKMLQLSAKGASEIANPCLYKKKLSHNFREEKTVITKEDKKNFEAFGSFLSGYNDEQKKTIISTNKHILCIAGAGSGKTTVLTKRIEFLINYKSVDPRKILAITFTRKARREMMKRLGNSIVMVETFNSFCEKTLRMNNYLAYSKPVRVVSYKDRVQILRKALSSLNLSMEKAIDKYFNYAQKRGRTNEQLASIFLNDCFFVRDYLKFKNRKMDTDATYYEESFAMVRGICNYIEGYMKKYGLRDFADQLIDTLSLFEKHANVIPSFEHVLVDEYQDVNLSQIRLIDFLSPNNFFCVGDPRQSIYGWRGSDIKYILNFKQKYPDAETLTLTKNYRSTRHIVGLINNSIRNMGLVDLEHVIDGKQDIKLLTFDTEIAEFEFVIQSIIASNLPRNEIFVLARTNRQLNELSSLLKLRGIKHIIRSDEVKRSVMAKENDITLATIHSIKGLEARLVHIIGCNTINFPCKGSEHPVIEMIKVDEYDKEEEERRLFYVAMSRAKESLYLSYTGNPTRYITSEMLARIEKKQSEGKTSVLAKIEKKQSESKLSNDIVLRLREWRSNLARELNIPAFIIMHDKTLIDLATKAPLTLSELENVHGIGPGKITKYGEDILKVISGC